MGSRRRKQDLTQKIDYDFIPSGHNQQIKKARKNDPKEELQVPVTITKACKPIFISQNLKNVRSIVSQTKLQAKPVYKISSAVSTQVTVSNIEDKASIINILRSQGIQFHTFSENSEKAKSFVLKGYYDAPTNEVLRNLQKAKVPAVKVTIIVKKPEFTFYLVHFQDENVNRNVLNHNHRHIDNIIVKWENIKKGNKSPTQCFNCQRWGHSSHNCGYKFRCVKCTEVHAPNQCKRTTRDGNAKCINCNGDHAANHRLCPTFISYSKRIEKSRSKIQSKVLPQISNILDSSNFPQLVKKHQASAHSIPVNVASPSSNNFQEVINQQQLVSNISYAEKLNEAVNNEILFKKFTEAQERLKRIPRIEEAINQYCSFVDELEKLPNDGTIAPVFNLMLKYGLTNYPPALNNPVHI
jgi:hypothetical protein